jgi:hypothetical protein
LLAASRKGCTKAMMRAHGFSIDMLLDLLKAGLATTKRERMVDGGRQTDVARVRITEAGRRALAKAASCAPPRRPKVRCGCGRCSTTITSATRRQQH